MAASVGLLEACDDVNLLAFPAHPEQRKLLSAIEKHRMVIACCGRRFGKTRGVAAAALHNLLLVPELDKLVSPGERRYAVSVANNRAQARIFVDHARSIVKSSPALRRELVSEGAHELVFRGDRVLSAFPCTAKGGRGWAVSFLGLDEFAHHFDIDEGGPAVASRIWAAMTPSVAQFGDLGRVVVISTPFGSDGLFAELFAKASNGELPKAAAFHAPTSANPMVDADYLAAQEAALGSDDFRREFGAEFIAGGASFIEAARVREVVADRDELLPSDALRWVCALDPAFSNDPTALVIVGQDPFDKARLLVGRAERWLPPRVRKGTRKTRADQDRAMADVLDQVAERALRYQGRVISDQHLPGTIVDELRKRGVHAMIEAWTAKSKTEAFQAVRGRIYTNRIELPNNVQLIAELCRLRTNYRAGSTTVEVPRVGDSHCDLAIALAAAVWHFDRYGAHSGGQVWKSKLQGERQISAGFADLGPGMVPRDSTRRRKWYDQSESMLGRKF
jgi:hypothetical protein